MPKKNETIEGELITPGSETYIPGDKIVLQGVNTHNLKDIDVTLPKDKIITVTGVSGSGKSSLAFHTIYKEGQFRYIESLSSYLRQFFNLGSRPEIEYSSGLSPAIAIEQNKRVGNSRSTVGTLTEIDDYLRLLIAKTGKVFCYECGRPLSPKTTQQIMEDIASRYQDQKIYLLTELQVYTDAESFMSWSRKNRRQVDQGGGFTRYLVGYGYNKKTRGFDESVEYFYLEEPVIPDHLYPVIVYGVFDRVTINNSTMKRLKDDVIKMLSRSDKFGVMLRDQTQSLKKRSSEKSGYRFILLHGYKTTPESVFFPWLKKSLEDMGHEVIIPSLPNTKSPNIDTQIEFVKKYGQFDERTILVGHSLGGVIAQRVVEQIDTQIAGLMLVGSFGSAKLKRGMHRDYFETTDWIIDTAKILGKAQKVMVLHDDKDLKIPKAQFNMLKKRYGHGEIVKAEVDHFTGDEEPTILEAIVNGFGLDEIQAEKKVQNEEKQLADAGAVHLGFTSGREKKLKEHEHTADGAIHTTRAIIRDKKGKILGLYDTRFRHYQLPGGKVDTGEVTELALAREVQEETGCEVFSAKLLGTKKLICRVGLEYSYLYEVIVEGNPSIMEPEKFSHISRGTVKKDKRLPLGLKVVFEKEDFKTVQELMEGGTYQIRSAESGMLQTIKGHEKFPFVLPDHTVLDGNERYKVVADMKAKQLIIKNSEELLEEKQYMVYELSGDNLLAGLKTVYVLPSESKLSNATLPASTTEFGASATAKASTVEVPIIWYTDKYYCPQDNISYPEFSTQHFSPNRQEGACPQCLGVGEELQVDMDKVLDPYSTYLKAILPWRDSRLGQGILLKLSQLYKIDTASVRGDLPGWFTEIVLNGDGELLRIDTGGGKHTSITYNGIQEVLTSQYKKGVLTVDFQAMIELMPCSKCHGAKLRPESLHVYLVPQTTVTQDGELLYEHEIKQKFNIFDLQSIAIRDVVKVLEDYLGKTNAPQKLVERITTPLVNRSQTIDDLGLGYMSTSRQINTLSGGEIQRLRLAKQLGNKLTGILYVLDEPTIGLDEKEIYKVIEAIKQLQKMGNTIIVVEHNEEFIKASDRVVEIGPGAGDFGGNMVFAGSYDDFLKQDSLTAKFIRGERKMEATFDHTPSSEIVSIKNATKHNLQGINVDIKLGSFTIITGGSGAGKTTLMYHTLFSFLQDKQKYIQSFIRLKLLKQGLSRQEIISAPVMKREEYEHLEKVGVQEFYKHLGVDTITGYEGIDNTLYVNQASIGKTPRSCPATFIGVFDDIRKIYAGATESKMLAFTSGHFSFNSNKGACPECNGYGEKKIELQFLPDTYVPCPLCKGSRYKPEILDIKRHGKNISEVLEMYVDDAADFFADLPFIYDKLKLMCDIGLGYLRMGQPAHTLSGGESQRIKLVKHLLKSYRGHTVYFLDEPTVGLHPSDIEKLLWVIKRFLDNGDTILMIEHEKNLLQFADKVIRLEEGKVVKGRA